ncbi:hypothetical protein SESBI_46128 [Sesbania bispinosa]|nr:hypothetical protein SESBI_46128 [Sesbania bispinosa]
MSARVSFADADLSSEEKDQLGRSKKKPKVVVLPAESDGFVVKETQMVPPLEKEKNEVHAPPVVKFQTATGMGLERKVVSYKDVCLGVNGHNICSDDDMFPEENQGYEDMLVQASGSHFQVLQSHQEKDSGTFDGNDVILQSQGNIQRDSGAKAIIHKGEFKVVDKGSYDGIPVGSRKSGPTTVISHDASKLSKGSQRGGGQKAQGLTLKVNVKSGGAKLVEGPDNICMGEPRPSANLKSSKDGERVLGKEVSHADLVSLSQPLGGPPVLGSSGDVEVFNQRPPDEGTSGDQQEVVDYGMQNLSQPTNVEEDGCVIPSNDLDNISPYSC